MNETESEEFPGGFAVAVAVESPSQVGEVEIEGQGVCSKGPACYVKDWCQGTQTDHADRVPQCHTLAKVWVDHRHHAISTPGIVLT